MFDLCQASALANATTRLQTATALATGIASNYVIRWGISTAATTVRCQPSKDKVSGARMEPRVCAKHGARRLSAQPYIHKDTHLRWLLVYLPGPMTPHRRWVERARTPCCLVVWLQDFAGFLCLACGSAVRFSGVCTRHARHEAAALATRTHAHIVNTLNIHQQVSKNKQSKQEQQQQRAHWKIPAMAAGAMGFT